MIKYLPLLALFPACYLRSLPVTPAVAEDSTYEVITDTMTATAWAVSPRHLVTAGHVCGHALTFHEELVLRGASGHYIPARLVELEVSPGPGADLCVLAAEADVARPLVLAATMPREGAVAGYVGFPLGAFKVSSGVYRGEDWIDAPCDHGASGSAFYTGDGVFGVLTQLEDAGGCRGTMLPELRSFLEDAGVMPATAFKLDPDDQYSQYSQPVP